jgi:hypothetical protein
MPPTRRRVAGDVRQTGWPEPGDLRHARPGNSEAAEPSLGMSSYVLLVPARPASPLATATKALMARFAAHVSHNRHHGRWRAGNLDAKANALRRMPSPWMMKRLGKPPRSLKLLHRH